MRIHYETATLRDIIDSHAHGKLVLPNFQREFVWSLEDQRQLLTSLLADIPIGSVLLLRGKATDFAARHFGRGTAADPAAECTFLLDGQQRLSCVHQFLSDPLSEEPGWESVTRETYYNLRYRWLGQCQFCGRPLPDARISRLGCVRRFTSGSSMVGFETL